MLKILPTISLFSILLCGSFAMSEAATSKEEIAMGQRSFGSQKYDEARSHFTNALSQTPSSEEKFNAELFIGLSYMAQGKPAPAATTFEKIVSDDTVEKSGKNSVRSLLAACYSAIGEFAKSREQNADILKDGSSELKSEAQFSIAISFFQEGKYYSSIEEFKKYLTFPNLDLLDIVSGRIYLGDAYFYRKNYSDAIEQFEHVSKTQIPESLTGPLRRTVIQFIQQANFMLASVYVSQAAIRYKQVLQMDYPLPVYAASAKRNLNDLEALLQKSDQEIRRDKPISDGVGKTTSTDPKGKPENETTQVKVGQVAPDFTATDMNGKEFKLSDFREKKEVLLTFFPKCFTGGCTNHLSSLQERKADFDANDVEVVAISVDPAEGEQGQIAFAKMWGFKFRFLPDAERKVSMLYGAAQQPTDLASRMSVVIDKSGVVQIVDTDVNVKTHGSDILGVMKELGLVK